MISKHLLPSSIKHVFRRLGVSVRKVFLVRPISHSGIWSLEKYLNTLALRGHTGALRHSRHWDNQQLQHSDTQVYTPLRHLGNRVLKAFGHSCNWVLEELYLESITPVLGHLRHFSNNFSNNSFFRISGKKEEYCDNEGTRTTV